MTIPESQESPPEPEESGFDPRSLLDAITQGITGFGRIIIGEGQSPLADLRAALGHINPRGLAWGLISLALLGYFLTGIYIVAPGEAGVVRRFGAVVEPRAVPGLHYRLPWPVDRVDIVNVSEVRRETVGMIEPEEGHDHPEPPAKLQALSGDTNVIDIEIIVQYQVRDPAAYLLNVQYAPYRLVRDATRQAVTALVTRLPVDGILTTERQSLQNAIRTEAQARLDGYNSGLQVVSINLQKGFPPDEVAAAFIDVNSAKEDKVRAVNEATGYANSIIPEARGQAEKILSGGQAYRSNVLAESQGAAQAFKSLLNEYQTNAKIYGDEVTRYRLYLETLETILPRVQVYVVDTENSETFNLRLIGNPSNGLTNP
jgi:membrane protease subunit HflK